MVVPLLQSGHAQSNDGYNYPIKQTAPRTVTGALSYSSQGSHMADDLRDGLSHSYQRGPTYELFHFQNELPCHVLSRIFKRHIKGCSSSVPTPARAYERVLNTKFNIRYDTFGKTKNKRNTAAHFKCLFCKMETKRHNITRSLKVSFLCQREVCVCVYIYICVCMYTHARTHTHTR
jgi:hypothetical protein